MTANTTAANIIAAVTVDDGRETTVYNVSVVIDGDWVDGWDVPITASRQSIEAGIRADWPGASVIWDC